jgi:hypothetical protein
VREPIRKSIVLGVLAAGPEGCDGCGGFSTPVRETIHSSPVLLKLLVGAPALGPKGGEMMCRHGSRGDGVRTRGDHPVDAAAEWAPGTCRGQTCASVSASVALDVHFGEVSVPGSDSESRMSE